MAQIIPRQPAQAPATKTPKASVAAKLRAAKLAELEAAQIKLAGFIAAGEEALLPIFVRLETEISALQKKSDALARVRLLAEKYIR